MPLWIELLIIGVVSEQPAVERLRDLASGSRATE